MGKAGEYLEDATVDNDLNAGFSDNAAEDRGAWPPSSRPDLRLAQMNEEDAKGVEDKQVKLIKRKYDSVSDLAPRESRPVRRNFSEHLEVGVVEQCVEKSTPSARQLQVTIDSGFPVERS